MNSLAQELNTILQGTVADALFSDIGREMFFPKGIVAQSAEAAMHANRLNATAGMAYEQQKPMIMPQLQELLPQLSASEIVAYAPTAGIAGLGKLWQEQMQKKNPDLDLNKISLPIVCNGLTHGISLCAEMFTGQGSNIVIPDMFWGNYRLIFEQRRSATIQSFPFFNADKQFNITAFQEALRKGCAEQQKCTLLLNFPNNPSGYSPTRGEAEQIVSQVIACAEQGNKLLVILDDAYFGFFYEEDIFPQSLFARLYNAHPNILAIKIDGITKEEFAWGLRVGFITIGSPALTDLQYDALKKKFMGMIRSSVSNVSNLSQNLMSILLQNPDYEAEKQKRFQLLQERYRAVKEIVQHYQNNDQHAGLEALPFNSGYFMTFRCNNAEQIRKALLERGIGIIAIQDKYIRIAFASVDIEELEGLYKEIFLVASQNS